MTFNTIRGGAQALLGGVSAAALSFGLANAQNLAVDQIELLEAAGTYLAGDKHNHTTCTDGSTSPVVLTNESIITYGLDWFAQTGHGGEGVRDCRFTDPEYDGPLSGDGNYWEVTIGAERIKGDEENTGSYGASVFFDDGDGLEMWRWQNLIEYAGPMVQRMGEIEGKPTWLGIETVVPGHEHTSMAILRGQFGRNPNFYDTGQFEYLWDRADDDTSGGEEFDFENPENNGVAKEDFVNEGQAGHERSVRSVQWLVDNFGSQSYYVPAHVERQGGFDVNGTRGFNVEHFRDYHTAGLLNPNNPEGYSIAMGAEMIAGHQSPRGGRGTYEADRPSAGLTTYGGAGAYGAAEVTVPGTDPGNAFLQSEADGGEPFDQTTPLTTARLEEIRDTVLDPIFNDIATEPSGSDAYDSLSTDLEDVNRYVFARPGIRTMWDALLGEGRRFFIYGSSDWHNRGEFGPFEPQSTLDFWPGEYQRIWSYASGISPEFANFNRRVATEIVRGLREGNNYSVMGDLIDQFFFVVCQPNEGCATMGEELRVRRSGEDLVWAIKLRDPQGTNFSPYTFNNPSLLQVGIQTPMNAPVLSHIDVIKGDITSGLIDPADPAYTQNVSNPTVEIFATVDNLAGEFEDLGEGVLLATGTIDIDTVLNDFYLRVRGTNIPKGTPNETDVAGNPLIDDYSLFIECPFDNPEPNGFDGSFCPEHLPVNAAGNKVIDADVEAWADLWFYANPIFIDLRGQDRN